MRSAFFFVAEAGALFKKGSWEVLVKKETDIWHEDPAATPAGSKKNTVRARPHTKWNRWLDHLLSFEAPEFLEEKGFAPPYDIIETPTCYYMSLDLPGTAREDIHVKMVGEELIITGERKGCSAGCAERI